MRHKNCPGLVGRTGFIDDLQDNATVADSGNRVKGDRPMVIGHQIIVRPALGRVSLALPGLRGRYARRNNRWLSPLWCTPPGRRVVAGPSRAQLLHGVPYINGKRAIRDGNPSEFTLKLFSQWRCPECDAHLAKDSTICLNACHLSAAANRRFQAGLIAASSDAEK